MKSIFILTFAFLFTSYANSQSEAYWNNYANFNPAMSGFQHKQHATATYYNYFPSLSGNYTGLFADAGIRLAKQHGVGLVYTGDFNEPSESHQALANYNYQFRFDKAGKLSVGAGLGYGIYTYHNAWSSIHTTGEKRGSFILNLGASYKWKNLLVGFSATNLIQDGSPEYPFISYSYPPRAYNLHAEHTADLGRRFDLITRVLYSYQDGFQRLQPNLTLVFLEKVSLGASYEFRNSFGVNVGYDILNQFRLAYNYSSSVSMLGNGVSGGKHEITIGYVFKNKIATITRTKR